MKAVFEKIIERLEEKALEHAINGQQFSADGWDNHASEEYNKRSGLEEAIEIVNQVVGEYAIDINVGNNGGRIPCSLKDKLPKQTKADRIRSMSVEELADRILVSSAIVEIDFCQNISECDDITTHGGAIPDEMCKKCLIQWLNSPE